MCGLTMRQGDRRRQEDRRSVQERAVDTSPLRVGLFVVVDEGRFAGCGGVVDIDCCPYHVEGADCCRCGEVDECPLGLG
jgi:hypothetical protein